MALANVIMDIEGVALTAEEQEMIVHPSVAGVILFSRNYQDRRQVKALTTALHQLKPGLIVAVDQEGGRVQRFEQEFTQLPSMRHWGQRYLSSPKEAIAELIVSTTTMVEELQSIGVNLSIAPVLDCDYGLSEVIADRSFGQDVNLIGVLGRIVIDTMHASGMTSVAKHFPGHGGVTADSHFELPVDRRSWDEVWSQDMRPFRDLAECYDALMPAHIIFSSINEELVSYSHYWLQEVLRNKLEFQGAIMSDDLTMNAATHIGDYDQRTKAALDAGCDVLIACNQRAGTIKVIESSARYTQGKSNEYLQRYLKKFTPIPAIAE